MQDNGRALPTGLRILLVEDEVLIALDCEAMLLGLDVGEVRRARTVAEGLCLLEKERFDAAILDVRLGDGDSLPLARRLAELGVPFGLVSGLVDEAIPAGLKGHPQMSKPFNLEEVRKLLSAVLTAP
jgi:DNA-binding response OmpR family regulator